MQRVTKLYQKYAHLMRGRYGRFDQINKALLVLWAIMMILDRWIPYYIGNILAVAAFALVLYRFLSKKIYPRSNENQKFIQWIAQMKDVFKGKKATYSYFKCPECKQKMRAPKGRGKIKVTCKNCHTQFTKKV
ncbi:hypothetical protein A5865_000837 [Enterococcus sp. 12E11_DIV0728]|jgi:hypothetical protein|nr:hypothetical protein A5865_000837 [Enterococcus sp. 12E11_DIV0728]OUZ16877.1 hypothetical protein A5868_001800 [Enterococcus sp. 12F9_DIV0723]